MNFDIVIYLCLSYLLPSLIFESFWKPSCAFILTLISMLTATYCNCNPHMTRTRPVTSLYFAWVLAQRLKPEAKVLKLRSQPCAEGGGGTQMILAILYILHVVLHTSLQLGKIWEVFSPTLLMSAAFAKSNGLTCNRERLAHHFSDAITAELGYHTGDFSET